jgi:hypothetical protein
METFLAADAIARQRGDGLKPELVRLLERIGASAETGIQCESVGDASRVRHCAENPHRS